MIHFIVTFICVLALGAAYQYFNKKIDELLSASDPRNNAAIISQEMILRIKSYIAICVLSALTIGVFIGAYLW